MLILIRRALYIILLLGALALISFGILFTKFLHTPLRVVSNQILFVPPGGSLFTIADTLYSGGYLSHPKWFILLGQMKGGLKKLKAGEYLLEVGITPDALMGKLVAGKVYLRHLTIIEGWTAKQVFASILKNPYLAHTTIYLTPAELAQKMGTSTANLEGYLYPDTYLFTAGIPDIVLLKKAFHMMQKKLNMLWESRAADLPYNDTYSALIVASLIEKETARPEERPKIAGVIARRLKQGMPLQIDAAVIYGLGENYQGTLTRDNLKLDTPYNTYLHKGLPPTPIGMPSLPSLIAALHPEAGTSLYYVARGNGTHEFTATLSEHHEAIHKFRAKQMDNLNFDPLLPKIVSWFNGQNYQQSRHK